MTKITKRIFMIICGVLAAALVVLGAVFTVHNREDKVSAHAVTNSANLTWNEGAWVRAMTKDTDIRGIAYKLTVNETGMSNGEQLKLYIDETNGGTGTFYSVDYFGSTANLFDENIWSWDKGEAVSIITFNRADLSFTNGSAVIMIRVFVDDIYAQMVLKAEIGSECAVSDLRSVDYLWQRGFEAGDIVIDEGDLYSSKYFKEHMTFSSVSEDSFSLSETVGISYNQKLFLSVNIPSDVSEKLTHPNFYQGESVKTEYSPPAGWKRTFTFYCYTLDIYTSSELNSYSNANRTTYIHGSNRRFLRPLGDPTWDTFLGDSRLYYDIEGTVVHFPTQGKIMLEINAPLDGNIYIWAQLSKHIVTRTLDTPFLGFFAHATDNISGPFAERQTTNTLITSYKEVALDYLNGEYDLSDGIRRSLQEIAGVATDTEVVPITLNYKRMSDYSDITSANIVFNVKSVYAQNKNLVLSSLYQLTDFKNIAKLNVVYNGDYFEGGYRYSTQSRIFLQAKDFKYSYDNENKRGTIEVVYEKFNYKDLSIKIANNDPDNHLQMEYYTSDAIDDGNTITLKYDYETIKNQMHNSTGWLFDMDKNSVEVVNCPTGVSVTMDDDALTVRCAKTLEDSLQNLSLSSVAEIMEDTECLMTVTYKTLSRDGRYITESNVTTEPVGLWYSDVLKYNTFENVMKDYGDVISAGVSPEFLNGVKYANPTAVHTERTQGDVFDTYNVIVEYDYNTLFAITNNYDNSIVYKELSDVTLLYKGDYFVDSIPDGYRVARITSSLNNDKVVIRFNEDLEKTTVEVKTSANKNLLIPIDIEFTDEWVLKVNYLEDYIDYRMRIGNGSEKACFAQRKTLDTTIKVKDYPDIYALTKEDVQKILGKQDLSILGLSNYDGITVNFDGISTYVANVNYSYAALRQIDYDGNINEVKIPLTSYADWCAAYGKEWSILFLNSPDRNYFQYSNDVTRENLYGFFSVAVFEEQVSDLNYYFKNTTGDGNITMYEECQVQGSKIYNFFNKMREKGVILSTLGHVGMAFCDLINDANHMQYSYFFYLDGTTNMSYLSNGGADGPTDTDDALDNKVEDIKEEVQEKWDSLTNRIDNWWEEFKESDTWRVIKIVLICVASLMGLLIIVRVVRIFIPRGGGGGFNGGTPASTVIVQNHIPENGTKPKKSTKAKKAYVKPKIKVQKKTTGEKRKKTQKTVNYKAKKK